MTATPLTWDVLVGQLAELAGVPPDAVTPDARLVEHIGLDSLAIAELVLILVQDHGIDARVADAEGRDWSRISAGQLLEEVTA